MGSVLIRNKGAIIGLYSCKRWLRHVHAESYWIGWVAGVGMLTWTMGATKSVVMQGMVVLSSCIFQVLQWFLLRDVMWLGGSSATPWWETIDLGSAQVVQISKKSWSSLGRLHMDKCAYKILGWPTWTSPVVDLKKFGCSHGGRLGSCLSLWWGTLEGLL
jgi:hypothetical protein